MNENQRQKILRGDEGYGLESSGSYEGIYSAHERQMAPGSSEEGRRLRTGWLVKQLGICCASEYKAEDTCDAVLQHSQSDIVRSEAISKAVDSFEAGPLFFCSRRRPDYGSATLYPSYGFSTSLEVCHHDCQGPWFVLERLR